MRCPYCGKELPGSPCPHCDAVVPEEAQYCMACGAFLGRGEDDAGGEDGENGFDIENRVLCPDGTCTGIIIDGRCTECGKILEDQ